MDSRDVIRRLEAEGWQLKSVRGSHHQFTKAGVPGKVTVPHPRRDIPVGTLRQIARQSGVAFNRRDP